ncbi:hypothetical protein CROQUDRAFT_111364 [Cronartium quercuum f. sp. fusiforme G11]|uniref:Pseudouridine synthase I TruA alpha/beta domain-containing protein n=1 Tax=Cronartium quercuum f. sp. fusiforme G11 TaxID=708437 RepID=A0A9P6N5W8_9BASI|nr:hypothetical protein CROQUDRAFT_111364 [Cronartium quercuum f. sp. fusiforme G11]
MTRRALFRLPTRCSGSLRLQAISGIKIHHSRHLSIMADQDLSKEDLIAKIRLLEKRIADLEATKPIKSSTPVARAVDSNSSQTPVHALAAEDETKKKKRGRQKCKRKFEFKHYPTRKIALQLTYQGWHHGGLAWQPEQTPLTTVEGELFRALLGARLVELADSFDEEDRAPFLESEQWRAAVNLEQWGYSRAGRTDAGVSGTGQVVSLWLRSNITDPDVRQRLMSEGRAPVGSFRDPEGIDGSSDEENAVPGSTRVETSNRTTAGSGQELPYMSILNSLLPDSIRVIAWSPVSPEFDSRFSCHGRHYKYFFTRFEASPQYELDIDAMRDGARRLVGEHDFRNLCKLDKSKQIENFRREIYSAEISVVNEQALGSDWSRGSEVVNSELKDQIKKNNTMYVLDLRGSAFLYNQVRNIMAILFLIGSKLEPPALVDGLLYTDSSAPKPDGVGLVEGQFVDRKPEMAIASELPLVLWKCIYPPNTFQWKTESLTKSNAVAPSKIVELMRAQTARYRLKSIIALHQLQKLYNLHDSLKDFDSSHNNLNQNIGPVCQVFGAGESQWTKNYRSILNRPRSIPYNESNQKWLASQGEKILKTKV